MAAYQTYSAPPQDQFDHLPLEASPMVSRTPSRNDYQPRDSSYGGVAYQIPRASSGYGEYGAGLQSGAPKSRRKGRVARFFSAYKTKNCLSFLGLIVIQSAAVLAMIGLLYGEVNNGIGDLSFQDTFLQAPRLEPIATYLSLFILGVFFELLVALDALQEKNVLSLVLLLIFQCAMIIYSALLPSQLVTAIRGTNADTPAVRGHVRAYAIVIPSVIAGGTVLMAWLIWRLYDEFGWDIYKTLGADLKIKRFYFTYQVFLSLLKFDFFLFVGFCIQLLVLVSGIPTAELAITIAALPIILVCLVLGAIFVRRETRAGTYTFLFFQLLGVAYFLYKLVRIYDSSSSSRYLAARKTLTLFGAISLLFLILTFFATGLCMLHFDQGLRERIPGYRFYSTPPRKEMDEKTDTHAGAPLDHNDTRMSLD